MKDYLIESMTSYMRKLDMPAQHRAVHPKKLNESAQDMWVLVPSQNRYDDPIDVMKFAKKYGVFDSMSKAIDKAEELAPDRYDAFIPYRLYESLTEARNPENDEINELIKKASYSGKLGKRTEQALAQYGIKADHNRMALVGPNGRAIRLGYPRRGVPQPQRDADWSGMFGSTSEKHYMGKPGRVDNFDYLNYLTVDRDFEDKGRDFYNHYKIENPGEDTDIRHNFSVVNGSDLGYEDRRSPESKSLRPYSDEYKVRAAEKQQAQDKVNKAKQELKQKNKDLKKFVADAKTRKNESLSLKEDYSKEDILSYIETLIDIWSEVYEDVRVGDYDAIEYKIDDIESNEYAVMRFLKSFIK